jgi:hypothetical protein
VIENRLLARKAARSPSVDSKGIQRSCFHPEYTIWRLSGNAVANAPLRFGTVPGVYTGELAFRIESAGYEVPNP